MEIPTTVREKEGPESSVLWWFYYVCWSFSDHWLIMVSQISYKDPINIRNSWDEKSMSKWAMIVLVDDTTSEKYLSVCAGVHSTVEKGDSCIERKS